MSFTIGQNVGAYRIIAQLGQGGMATVFKAYHPGLDRYVAVKVMHPAFKQDPGFVQRFNREARIVARLEHPNIVPVYDYAEHAGHPYLVMRFVEGETLKARLRRGPLGRDQIIQVASQVGAALSHAHGQGILHRDIKPSNVLLTGDPEDPHDLGDIFLTDFGLARIAEAGESTLSKDMMMGTPQYISPEQAKGIRDLDAGTDIYSLGVLLFELVTGRVPFSADTPYSIIHDHIFTPLPLPTSIEPNVSAQTERVLLRALAKEREDRYPDVDSFITALVDALEEEGAAPPPFPPPAEGSPEAVVATALPAPVPEPGVQAEDIEKALSQDLLKKPRRTSLLVVGGALLVLCLCSLVILGPVRKARQQNATATAQAAVEATRPAPTAPVEDPQLAAEIAAAEQRVDQNPRDPYAHIDLARLYLTAGAVEKAEEQLRQALDLRPDDEQFYLEVGRQLLEAERPDLAAETYVAGLEAVPDSSELRTGLVQLLWGTNLLDKDPARAEKYARRLVGAQPEDPLFHLFLAQTLIRGGKLEEAKAELDSVLETHPDMPEAHLVNAHWFRKNRQPVQARQELRTALGLAGDRAWLRAIIEREMEGLDAGE
jgi:serine/threonine protein kinase/Tfp pilus assembly protein PilF